MKQRTWYEALYETFVASKETQLFNAIKRGDAKRVGELVNAGVRSNTLRNSMTPLVYALTKTKSHHLLPVLSALFSRGDIFDVQINKGNKRGDNPLILAIELRKLEAVQLILQQPHIDINSKGYGDKTPLITAAHSRQPKIVKLLLEQQKIDIDAKDHNGWTALIHAIYDGEYDVVKLLLAHNQDNINAQDNNVDPVLMYAITDSRYEILKLLLKQPNINVNVKDSCFESTALVIAAQNGALKVVNLLLQQPDIDINAKSKNDRTALMSATAFGHLEIVKLLLEQPKLDNTDRKTTLDYAKQMYNSNRTSPFYDDRVNASIIRQNKGLALIIDALQKASPAKSQETINKKFTVSFNDREGILIKKLGPEKVKLAIPTECYCPISQMLIEDPVLMSDGTFYEKSMMIEYLAGTNKVSPINPSITLTAAEVNKTPEPTKLYFQRMTEGVLAKLEAELANSSVKTSSPTASVVNQSIYPKYTTENPFTADEPNTSTLTMNSRL